MRPALSAISEIARGEERETEHKRWQWWRALGLLARKVTALVGILIWIIANMWNMHA